MKNVTGYDLVKLMAGSYGCLGVLSEVAFKVLPRPEAEATLVCDGLAAAAAVRAMSQALGSPYEVTGAAYVGGQVRLRIEGMAGSVAYRTGALAKLLGAGWDVVTDQSAALWREVRDVQPLAGKRGQLWRVSVKPSDMPQVLAGLAGAQTVCDWGGGLIWARVEDALDMRALIAPLGGHATLLLADGGAEGPAFHPEAPAVAAISAGLRAKFDPRGILNPGLMG
jgi:glycolate oxidase FAD binding subunit